MDKKDIIILVAVFTLVSISFYRRYAKKKGGMPGAPLNKPKGQNSLGDQPDDYEPYSGKKNQA